MSNSVVPWFESGSQLFDVILLSIYGLYFRLVGRASVQKESAQHLRSLKGAGMGRAGNIAIYKRLLPSKSLDGRATCPAQQAILTNVSSWRHLLKLSH
jgi:hypothetical protein